MPNIKQQLLSRVKYGIVNIALAGVIITALCVSSWVTLAPMLLWNSILSSFFAFAWYADKMRPPPSLSQVMLGGFSLLIIGACLFPLGPMINSDFIHAFIFLFSLFNMLFEDIILISPLRSYFIETAVLNPIITRATRIYGSSQGNRIKLQEQPIPSTEWNCVPKEEEVCSICLEPPYTDKEAPYTDKKAKLVFAQTTDGNNQKPPLQHFYHEACFKEYQESNHDQAISFMSTTRNPVVAWHTCQYQNGTWVIEKSERVSLVSPP